MIVQLLYKIAAETDSDRLDDYFGDHDADKGVYESVNVCDVHGVNGDARDTMLARLKLLVPRGRAGSGVSQPGGTFIMYTAGIPAAGIGI